jgi:transcription elongation factor GreA
MTDYKKIYLTQAGYNKLQRMKKIFNDCKPQFTLKVNRAKSHGDLKENFEYTVAIGEKNMIDNKITTINQKISNCYVIDISKIKENKVVYGACIGYRKLSDTVADPQEYYVLVSDEESNMDYKLLSMDSLIGQKLLGKRVGDQFQIGQETYVIESIIYDAEFVDGIVSESAEKELAEIQKSIAEDLSAVSQ